MGVGYPEIEAAEATWEYNSNGQVTAVIDGNGNRAELRYDGHMRQDRWTFPSTTRAAAFNDATQATALASASHSGEPFHVALAFATATGLAVLLLVWARGGLRRAEAAG